MPSQRILICGAGIAGSIAAYWLGKDGFEVVVVERSKTEQKLGQGLEIEEPALQVVKAMGIFDKLNERKTGELGFTLFDEQGRSWAKLGVEGFSPTGSLELMRGDMTDIFYRAADAFSNVTYRFETTIHSLVQTEDEIVVDLEKRTDKTITTEHFDMLIGADGITSRTRRLVFGSPDELQCLKPVGAFVSYFSIPKEPQDWPNSQMCHFPGRRLIWTRPVGKESKTTSACFIYCKDDLPHLRQANAARDRPKQKQAFAELYSGLGWQTSRIVEGMMKAENFYSDELMQVKLKTWSKGRVVLLGDSAWAPTPFTGQGNQLAIIGAWVLAQELSRSPSTAAFASYEKRLRSYVDDSQKLPIGGYAQYILNPQTSWGIWVLRWTFFVVSQAIRFYSWLSLPRIWPDHRQAQAGEFDLEMRDEKTMAA
ncbi:MAG: hypothetical protein M1828_006667 [Chrysothrix sp. TS-e1954]|nr:MAG: hypothetical protein M1828_006667 [Chrysothrix sp. TS-e1954]